MKSVQRNRCVWFILVAAVGCMLAGCPKPPRRGGSWTTTSGRGSGPASTTVPASSDVVEITETVVKPVEVADTTGMEGLERFEIAVELPAPAFRGTPVPLKEANVEKPRGGPRPPFFAPKGTVNLALHKPVSTSDPVPPAGEVDFVTDGEKEASDFGYLALRPGTEWVQIDLGDKRTIYWALLWHNHAEARVYRDVIVQISDDPDFLDAKTVFNNDVDGTSGLGIGDDMGYVETNEGKLIQCGGHEGRYVRLYSKGSHIDSKNHYTEVEIYGR